MPLKTPIRILLTSEERAEMESIDDDRSRGGGDDR
jgi:hypothetical protein